MIIPLVTFCVTLLVSVPISLRTIRRVQRELEEQQDGVDSSMEPVMLSKAAPTERSVEIERDLELLMRERRAPASAVQDEANDEAQQQLLEVFGDFLYEGDVQRRGEAHREVQRWEEERALKIGLAPPSAAGEADTQGEPEDEEEESAGQEELSTEAQEVAEHASAHPPRHAWVQGGDTQRLEGGHAAQRGARARADERQSGQAEAPPSAAPESAQPTPGAEEGSSSEQADEREEGVEASEPEVSTHTSSQKLGLDGARISPPEAPPPPPVSRPKPPLPQRRFRLVEEAEGDDLRAPMLVRPTLDERFIDGQPDYGQLSHAFEAAQVMHVESMSDARLDRPIVRAPLFLGTLWSGADRFNALIETLEPLILIQDNIDRERSEFFSFFGEDLASRRLSREELDGWWMSFHRLPDPRPLPALSTPAGLEADEQMRRERTQRLDRIEAASARQRAVQSRYEAPQPTEVAQRPAPASRVNAHTPAGFDARPLHDERQAQPSTEAALARELSALAELPESGGNLALVEADEKAKAKAEAEALRAQAEADEARVDLDMSASDSPETLSALLASAEPLELRFDPSSLQRAVAERERVQRDRRVARKRKGREEVRHRAALSAQRQEAEVETLSQPFTNPRGGSSLIKVHE